jgi:hypothetical protein
VSEGTDDYACRVDSRHEILRMRVYLNPSRVRLVCGDGMYGT